MSLQGVLRLLDGRRHRAWLLLRHGGGGGRYRLVLDIGPRGRHQRRGACNGRRSDPTSRKGAGRRERVFGRREREGGKVGCAREADAERVGRRVARVDGDHVVGRDVQRCGEGRRWRVGACQLEVKATEGRRLRWQDACHRLVEGDRARVHPSAGKVEARARRGTHSTTKRGTGPAAPARRPGPRLTTPSG